MKQRYFILTTAIVAALASAPGFAQSTTSADVALGGISATEAPRVTQTVSNARLSTIPKSHLAIVVQAVSATPLDGMTAMNHLQLVLKPSALRAAEMELLITNQHNPKSAQFHQWLTPQQFGASFGAADSDVAAVSAWLLSQGFTVNGVYPNKTQIDFSGTAAQINQAFHTQENVYKLRDGSQHFANAGDISVPAALQPVITGVMGLNNMQSAPKNVAPTAATWNAGTHRFDLPASKTSSANPMTIGQGGLLGLRGLVPNDLAKMYGVSTIRNNGVTGKGITIALVELGAALPNDWSNFVSQFNLGSLGGTFRQFNPQLGNLNNCYQGYVGNPPIESYYSAEDMEAATAIAPGANIEVAYCSSLTSTYQPVSTNIYEGLFIAATNLVNGDERPDIMSFTFSYGEDETDSASEAGIDLVTAQADAEGISIFAATGNTGTDPDFNGQIIQGGVTLSAGSLASSPHVTAVGGTDLADELDGTTSQYFSSTPNAVYGTALGYVPEIPWNASCGNGVAAKAYGFSSATSFCQFLLPLDPAAKYVTSIGSSSGASLVVAKPAWQRLVFNAAKDQSRDIPDVALFGGSYANDTGVVVCAGAYPCAPNFTTPVLVVTNQSLAAPMFAGVQALIDQGIAMRGLPADQGNAAPTLYALAQKEYGGASGTNPASLAACNADNGDTGTASCVFHNITRGSTSTQCIQGGDNVVTGQPEATPHCYFYATADVEGYAYSFGLTTTDAAPTSYGTSNKAYGAQPGWSFASGLGSVNATNLLIAWRAFVDAPAAAPQ